MEGATTKPCADRSESWGGEYRRGFGAASRLGRALRHQFRRSDRGQKFAACLEIDLTKLSGEGGADVLPYLAQFLRTGLAGGVHFPQQLGGVEIGAALANRKHDANVAGVRAEV